MIIDYPDVTLCWPAECECKMFFGLCIRIRECRNIRGNRISGQSVPSINLPFDCFSFVILHMTHSCVYYTSFLFYCAIARSAVCFRLECLVCLATACLQLTIFSNFLFTRVSSHSATKLLYFFCSYMSVVLSFFKYFAFLLKPQRTCPLFSEVSITSFTFVPRTKCVILINTYVTFLHLWSLMIIDAWIIHESSVNHL